MNRFADRTVLITGGGRGIGRATALRLAREGASVAVIDRDAEPADAVAAEIRGLGCKAIALLGDIVDPDAGPRFVAATEVALGPVDVLVNNAAHTTKATLEATEPHEWDAEMAVTLRAAWLMAKAALPGMVARRKGAIVNIASVNGLMVFGNPAYSAAKAGMISLTQSIAIEYGPKGVRCNAVSPGTIKTDHPSWQDRMRRDPNVFQTLAKWYAVGRIGRPDDIANCVAFLASDDAAFVNGSNLVADGGLTAGMLPMIGELTAGAP